MTKPGAAMPYDPNRRVPVVHVCVKEGDIAHLQEYEKKQNGAVVDLATSYKDLDCKVDAIHTLILERVPHDLNDRLLRVEGAASRRIGATGMLKWLLGLGGATALLAGYRFVTDEKTFESIYGGGEVLAVAFLGLLALILGTFAYLIRNRR